MTKQETLVRFAWKYRDKWHTYATDYETVSLMCATANLGIIELKGGMFTLKSVDKARQFLER